MGINSINDVSASLHGHNNQGHFARYFLWCKDYPINGSFTNNKINNFTPVNIKDCSCSWLFHYFGKKEALIIWNSVTMSYSDNIRKKTDADGQQTVNLVTALKPDVVWQVHTHIMILLFAVKLDSPPLWKQAVSSCHLLQKNQWQPFTATFHVYMS